MLVKNQSFHFMMIGYNRFSDDVIKFNTYLILIGRGQSV